MTSSAEAARPTIVQKLVKGTTHPSLAFEYIVSLIRSRWCVLKYQHILHRATFGPGFRLEKGGRLNIQGSGQVRIGRDVSMGMKVTPWTYDKAAVIEIGDHTYLNGTRFACQSRVTIGSNCILAECRVMDTDFHGVDPEHRDVFFAKPITIGDNVWITINSVILKGVTIGSGSTITPNSVVTKDVPENCVFGGNPAVVVKSFDKGGGRVDPTR